MKHKRLVDCCSFYECISSAILDDFFSQIFLQKCLSVRIYHLYACLSVCLSIKFRAFLCSVLYMKAFSSKINNIKQFLNHFWSCCYWVSSEPTYRALLCLTPACSKGIFAVTFPCPENTSGHY